MTSASSVMATSRLPPHAMRLGLALLLWSFALPWYQGVKQAPCIWPGAWHAFEGHLVLRYAHVLTVFSVLPCLLQALEAQKTAGMKRCYYDLSDMLATNPSGNVPYTPSIPLLYGLRESLGLLKAEGMDNVIARHHRCAAGPSEPFSLSGFVEMHIRKRIPSCTPKLSVCLAYPFVQ